MRRFGQYSTVGFAVFALFVVAGVIATALTSHGTFVIAGILIGIYFLYAIKVVDQCLRTCMLPGLKKHTLLEQIQTSSSWWCGGGGAKGPRYENSSFQSKTYL